MNTKKIFNRTLAVLILFSSITAYAAVAHSWKIDKTHTGINFSINHFFSAVTGNFKEYSGTISFDPDNLEGSSVSFTIPVTSVNTSDAKRDKHLQSADFFNAKKFPNITFTSDKFLMKDGKLNVLGDLTIRDVTKKVAFPIEIKGRMDHPFMKNSELLGIAINTKINRTSFGVGTGSWAATSVVGEDVLISINMELTRKK
ncbi:MAG: polyisoprenoid-binding protein [Bacteroidetes bacterium]|nr:MAG: polyisoprenoid-binding protein [Bacteroidota bacterium]